MIWSKPARKKIRTVTDTDGDEPATISISASPQTLTQANRIYFYSEIDNDSVLELNKQIDEAAKQMKIVQFTLDLPEPPPIRLHINSKGGELPASFCAADKIRTCSVPIYTYCEGEVASGATLISVSGKKRFMTKNSFFLIHQLSSDFWGKYAEFKDEFENLTMLMNSIKALYSECTKIPDEELNNILKRDLYLTPEQCLQWKMVDEII